MEPIVPAIIIALVWALRELLPVVIRAVREHRDSVRAPPLPRAEMPTPDFSAVRADRSGPFHALAPDTVATRAELAELAAEMRELHADLARRIELLSRDVGRLEGALAQGPPRPPIGPKR